MQLQLRTEAWERGAIQVQALVYSNAREQSLTKVVLRGRLEPPIDWSPPRVLLRATPPGRLRLPVEVSLAARDGRALGLLRIVSLPAFATAELREEGADRAVLRLLVDPGQAPGPQVGSVRLQTDRANFPVLEVPIRGMVASDLVIQPGAVDFGVVPEGRSPEVMITLRRRSGGAVRVAQAAAHLPVSAEVDVASVGRLSEVRLRLATPPPLLDLAGHLELMTDDPSEPPTRVPVRGVVASRNPFETAGTAGSDDRLLAYARAVLLAADDLTGKQIHRGFFGGVRDDRAVALMLRTATDEHWLVRSRAVEILGLLGARRAVELVRRAVTDDLDEEVRRAALAALAALEGRAALPDALLALQDDDESIRADATRVLAGLGDLRAVSALRCTLSDADAGVRGAAAAALRVLGATP